MNPKTEHTNRVVSLKKKALRLKGKFQRDKKGNESTKREMSRQYSKWKKVLNHE